ncbi:L-serine ammonia-lyase [Gordonia terrae]|uniref:L-serine dehydratase n=2 Tax=Gordonia terrae TaxID=2055 RepID=A0AAD0NU07_9ACTN|nr:L-serine ammonia-lyase [Gordonia terrae]VTR08856.1 L-serine dehydratase [Clostridioides difficile]ANY21598.1 L-serine ammonia-lyase [Gordonia terrae]AWO82326.1 L-serine ammonia-lyase [Gordonia terrae]VTS17404.1 L-serine dehydratase tdcG [Gordonia terrae]GAB44606.1 L-serine dehydratase [Gordonia terrae NBRC 100016]
MTVSAFDLFSVGIGPSSSHTVGPMRAAATFVEELRSERVLDYVDEVVVTVFGSLAATGRGHGTFDAIMLGLEGLEPETISVETKDVTRRRQEATGYVRLGGDREIPLRVADIFEKPDVVLDRHPNAMSFVAESDRNGELHSQTYYSVGGGFIVVGDECADGAADGDQWSPWAFDSAADLLALTARHGLGISEIMMRHEQYRRPATEVAKQLLHIRDVMHECQRNGMARTGTLPGGLNVQRRAHTWYTRLALEDPDRSFEHAEAWVNLVAMAVNEENASGGRVVTAPTNGAAGIIPAVLHYAENYTPRGCSDPDGVAIDFLLTASAIGSLYKKRASISGAEVGCQGEVGSAASMAAAALAQIMGGSPQKVENAAEIAMEHCLGLTCDPIGGLVQIPCIERNAISANKAITAARMALRGDGTHRVTLDEVIETMRTTGLDMHSKYKETSTGGLAINVAVNIVEC